MDLVNSILAAIGALAVSVPLLNAVLVVAGSLVVIGQTMTIIPEPGSAPLKALRNFLLKFAVVKPKSE